MNKRNISLPEEQHHYIEKDDYNRCIYHKRELDAEERIITVMHDAEQLIAICDKTGQQEAFDDGAILVTDGAYSREENSRLALKHNLKLVTTNLSGRKPHEIYADFIFSEDGKILLQCINGCAPEQCTYDPGNQRSAAYFKAEDCRSCPYRDLCKPRFSKTRAYKEVSWKAVERAKQQQYMKTEEFRQYARFRNGVEAIPSILRRRYNVDKIPTHGKNRTRLYFGFKIAALNFQGTNKINYLKCVF